ATRSRQAFDEARGDGIAYKREYHWDSTGRTQQRSDGRSAMRQDDVGRERDQFCRVSANFVGMAGRPARLDPRVAPYVPAQQRPKGTGDSGIIGGGSQKYAEAARGGALLPPRRKWPCRCRAAEQRDEVASFHYQCVPCFWVKDTIAQRRRSLLRCGISIPPM